LELTSHQTEQAALAGAVSAQQADAVATLDVERRAIEQCTRTKAQAHFAKTDQGHSAR